MKALERDALLSALEIQNELLGPTEYFSPQMSSNEIDPRRLSTANLTPDIRDTLDVVKGLNTSSWMFYSPLQYWSCSSQRVAEDTDIITTVNRGSRQSTSGNVTLRPSMAFSGNRFEDHILVATDALVITLVHLPESPVGRLWENRAQEISRQKADSGRMYPADGQTHASTLYEFRYEPLSYQDGVFLGVAYTLTTVYFSISLSRLAAFKSRLGLIVAIASQIALSITSSFTICAIFAIDLSKIPREAYPLVVLVVGLENIFRIVNAFIATPSESSTAGRMAQALGLTGHIALVSVVQNLTILWIFSKVAYPAVASFCVFVGIALAFDFFYLMMFFVPILSIDVRRTELSDALSRASMRVRHYTMPENPKKLTWTETLVRGDVPVSTRVAGTVIMIAFLLAAQSHFVGNDSCFQQAYRSMRHFKSESRVHQLSTAPLYSVDMNQTGTPVAWLQMQDHETAREVISIVKPNAHSYIARVYDPLVFVLSGSDRTPTKFGMRPFLPAVYDFAKHQSASFVVTVFLIVGAVSLLMNYLLWGELPEVEASGRARDEPLLSVKTLSDGHALDIVLLAASNEGVVVSVGLDRCTRVWDVRNGRKSHQIQDATSDIDPFPILTMAIDSDSSWLALLSSKNFVALWNISERRWGPVLHVDVKGRTPAAFFFGLSRTEPIDPIILVRHNGLMTELSVESGVQNSLQICKTPLVCARSYAESAPSNSAQFPNLKIIASSRSGCIHIASKLGSDWISEEIRCSSETPVPDKTTSILPLPALSSFLAVQTNTVELIDIITLRVTHTFATKPVRSDTLRCFHSMPRKGQCGSVCLPYLALAYTNEEDGSCVLQTYLPRMEGDTICFRCRSIPGSKACPSGEIVDYAHVVQHPGEWDVLPVGYVVGVHKIDPKPKAREKAKMYQPTALGLRRRGAFDRRLAKNPNDAQQDDQWEAWTLSLRGDKSTMKLSGDSETASELLVSSLGPIENTGKRSLAVALGNVVKIVTVGDERYDNDDAGNPQDAVFVGTASGRKKRSGVGRKKYS
jgi:hypothetical protein